MLSLSWIAVGGVVLAALCLPAFGEGGSRLELKHEYFWDRNGVWNHTPAFSLIEALSRKWSFGWEQEFDFVSGASRRLGSDKIGQFGDRNLDAVSGASKVEMRHSENPSLTYSHDGVTASASFYNSREDDYFSWSPSGSLSWDFNERNTTLGVSWAEFFDDFKPTGAFAGLGGKKRIHSFGVNLAQTVTPLTLVGLTANYIQSSGYLGHPYNPPMDSNGTMLTESVPHGKQAGALSGQIVQGYHLGDMLGSLNLDVRRYTDTWAMKSTTADLKLSQYLADGFYVRLRLRAYTQTGAAFAKPYYAGDELYRTGDIRDYPFSSWLGGIKLSGAFPDAWNESAFLPDRWDIKFDYTFRNTRGDKTGTPSGEPRQILYQLYGPDEEYTQGVIMVGLTYNL